MLTKELIQEIVGTVEKHPLKKYCLLAGGEIIESKILEYDDFMQCYGISMGDGFNVVVIDKESDDFDELQDLVEEWIVC